MKTSKEIFDYLVAKYPNKHIEVSEQWQTEKDEPHYFGIRFDHNQSCFTYRNDSIAAVAGLIAEVEAKMPTPESERAALLIAKDEALGKAAELTARIADLERKLNAVPERARCPEGRGGDLDANDAHEEARS